MALEILACTMILVVFSKIYFSINIARAIIFSFCLLTMIVFLGDQAISFFRYFANTCVRVLQRPWLSNGVATESQPEPEHKRVSQPESLKPIQLKIVIDRNRNQVLFAECNKDFVDVLLSFLILPLGKIIRLSDKESGIGSVDTLYKSVEGLSRYKFIIEACKNMLLDPRSAYGPKFDDLAVKLDETNYTKIYTCTVTPCLNEESVGLVSLVENSVCGCGRTMSNVFYMTNKMEYSSRGFVNRVERFIVSDDFQILPATISNTCLLLMGREIIDNTGVQEWNVNIGLEEVLKLLHRSLRSKTPLTDVFLPNNQISSDLVLVNHQPEVDKHNDSGAEEEIKVKLWFSKSTERVICVEAKEDFADFLFSFLTFPLGSIIKTLKGKSSLGSIDNLYNSAKNLSSWDIVCEPSKGMLLSPKLERMFGSENNLLGVEEETTLLSFKYNRCYSCRLQNKNPCTHENLEKLNTMNPKIPGWTKPGGSFVRGQKRLLVTDGLAVEPLSAVSGINRVDIPFSDLEELQVIVGKQEALGLLKAALTSKAVLTQAFSSQVVNRKKSSLTYN